MNFVLFMVIPLMLSAYSETGSLLPEANSCEFYLQLEQKRGCNNLGYDYVIQYGYTYCERFSKKKKSWLDPLPEWISNVTFCLQDDLYSFDDAYKSSLDEQETKTYCKNLEKRAFDSHHECYKAHGFCELPHMAKFSVIREILDTNIIYKAKSSLKQALKTAYDCSKYYVPRCNIL